ncbi:DNA repair protein complementing XP-C cells homolog isoform X2 [Nasonia vitripennis]|uniref:DNA repair protein complementing XP-C cells homolog n=1 Tax=Nasonia vitripennis TaxID=7425 RepID=A0A7M7IUD5_NASVI|nr:DNA repair protein complementing XP-C cells homolog isoform X2 [Nasonia vitripennis]
MSQLSDDDSSDSSNEFLVPADKIDLSSSFFNQSATKKPNPKKTRAIQSSPEDSDSEFDYSNDNNVSSTELLAQVLKNLENAKNQSLTADTSQSEQSASKQASDSKGDDLSKQINDLLMQGESASTLAKADVQDENEAEDSKAEVKSEYTIPLKGVQIHLPGENVMFDRKKKKERDLQKVLQSKINSRIRSSQLFIHKVGLLCWLSHGFFLNKLANEPELLAIALSLVSSSNYPKGRPDLKYMEKFTKWFTGQFKIVDQHKEVVFSKELLLQRFSDKRIDNYVELILLYIATVRSMGINCRLVISLRPARLKPAPEQLFKIPANEESDTKSKKVKAGNGKSTKQKKNTQKAAAKSKTGKRKATSKEQSVSPTKAIPENSREAAKTASEEAKKKAAAILKGKLNTSNKKTENSKKGKKDDSDSEEEKSIIDESDMTVARKLRLRTNKIKESENGKSSISKNKSNANAKSKADKSSKKRKHDSSSDEEFSDDESEFSSDEEYIEKKPKKRAKQSNKNESISSKLAKKSNKQRKLLSSDEDDQITVKNVFNVWVEVYVESEESWISIDVLNQKIHCVSDIYKKAGNPVLYVVAWNSAGTIKDVTRRYCPHWLTDTRKKRVDEKWWSETLLGWKEKKTAISKAEDEQLLQRELEQPLPKTMGECKGHPLYVLTRHLLKFEALYPPDAVPLGHLKTGEAIYSRHCVHTLMSRETWVKKARVVKPAQEAYKIVKSMPKYDKLSGMKIKDQPLELFGKWQTNPYEPPVAKDGKVPRNEYGNVDLFKMCMLPKGCVYINLPALNRVARKLNIDCAPACVGFNFGCRGALPAFEGYVVCAEYEDTVREAWEEEQVEAQKRAKERREKRIYGNWKKLIKGLLIREKLAAKYNFGDDDDVKNGENKIVKPTIKKAATTKKAPAKKAVKQTYRNILREESSDDEEEDSEIEEKQSETVRKSTRPTRKVVTRTVNYDESETDEEVRPVITEKKSIFKKINAAAITAKKAAEKDENRKQPDDEEMVVDKTVPDKKTTIAKKLKASTAKSVTKVSEKEEEDENVDDEEMEEVSKNVRPKRALTAKKVASKAKKISETEKSSAEEETGPLVTEKKSIFKKINAAAMTAKKAAKKGKEQVQAYHEDMGDTVSKTKTTIAKKSLSSKSATKLSRKEEEDQNVDDEEMEEASTEEKKNTRPKRTVAAKVKQPSKPEENAGKDEELKEFVTKNKKPVPPKKVTVTTTKVATRASKRNMQEPGNLTKKAKR